ncbi:hypothetical protein A0H81_01967 [Grifola frondosa]|uniref:Uncharacterized protein n=1 Tax=Grifola frondosa TaxID=5627 RepID=A0A1C7MNF2_GRIFR|nr:hypothetical protein A0H81_01967 [Grifola frondosa]
MLKTLLEPGRDVDIRGSICDLDRTINSGKWFYETCCLIQVYSSVSFMSSFVRKSIFLFVAAIIVETIPAVQQPSARKQR